MKHKITPLYDCGYVDSNVFIITDLRTNQSAVVDPDFQNVKIDEVVKNFDVKLILLTHAHFDHIASADKLRELTNAPIMIHEGDFDSCCDKSFNLSSLFGSLVSFNADKSLVDGEVIKLGESEIKVFHTPGHTKGSSCFIIGDDMISGDMFFNYSIGRTDFPGGSVYEMKNSIEKLKNLEVDYNVYPGHGTSTTLYFEKENNPYFISI